MSGLTGNAAMLDLDQWQRKTTS